MISGYDQSLDFCRGANCFDSNWLLNRLIAFSMDQKYPSNAIAIHEFKTPSNIANGRLAYLSHIDTLIAPVFGKD